MKNMCKICSNMTREIHQKTFGIYHVCDLCGFISKDKEDHVSAQAQHTIYDSHHNSIEDPVYVAYFNHFLSEAVFPFVNEGRYGLDFGSGPSPVLAQMLTDTYGYMMDIYDLFYSPHKSYINKTYDLITVTEVVEHLENPLDYLSLFRDHLNENGILSIMTQFHHNNDEDFLDWHYIRDRSHISFCNERTFEIIAEKLNLNIIYSDHKKLVTFRKQHNHTVVLERIT
jgi:hypothetical protein